MGGIAGNLSEQGIRINAIAPYWTNTAILPEEVRQAASGSEPTVSLQSPQLVAKAAVLLASDNNYHNKTISVIEGKFRELEGWFDKTKELAYGEEMWRVSTVYR
jgi:NAD(P)-dependent dehydrogenase (short-subunit alcohol dehydrogenase family)